MATVKSAVIVSVNGSPLVLLPGDEVPAGVRVTAPGVVSEPSPSVVDPVEQVDPDTSAEVVEPRGNASRKEWAAYATLLGVNTTDLTRNQIKEAINDIR